MSNRSRIVVVVAAAAAAWVLGTESRCRAAAITLIPSGSVNGTAGNAINAAGTVTGYYTDANFNEIGFTYSPSGGFTSLPLTATDGTPLEFTVPNGINDAGTVVGQATDSNFNVTGFRYTPAGGLTLLPLPAGGYTNGLASAINNAGLVVGSAIDPNSVTHGVVYQNGIATDITPTLEQSPSVLGGSALNAVNATGVATGLEAVQTATAGPIQYTQHAVIYNTNTGQFTDLTPNLVSTGRPGNQNFADAQGNAINSAGQVAYTTDVGGGATPIISTAYRYTGGTSVALSPSAGSTSSIATGIDTAGDVVGYREGQPGSDGNNDATVWLAGSTTGIDLNAYLASVDPTDAADWYLEQANAVNDSGQITGFGLYSPSGDPLDTGSQAAFILTDSSLTTTAVPEPTTLAVAASLGGAALLARRRRRAVI